MIPVKLKLTNFRSHESVEIDFSNIEIAAILGKNGVGKSSLVIALLYVIWGKVPKYKLIELINEDSEDMEVRYSFEHDDGCLYRIVRGTKIKGKKRKSITSHLTLSKYDDNEGWVDISSNSSGLTTLAIQNMVGGLTLDAAIYSSFAMQDEFSKFMDAEAGERRQIFELISNVKIYDRLTKKAKTLASEASTCMKTLDYDSGREVIFETKLKDAKASLVGIEKKVDKFNKQKQTLTLEIDRLEQIIDGGLDKENKKVLSIQERLDEVNENLKDYQKQVKKYKKLLLKKDEITSAYKQSKALEKEYDELVVVERELAQLNKDLAVATSEKDQRDKTLIGLQESQDDILKREEVIKKELRNKFDLPSDILIQEGLKELRLVREKEIELLDIDVIKLQEKLSKVDVVIKNYEDSIVKTETEVEFAQKRIKQLQDMDGMCPYLNKPCSFIEKDNLLAEIAEIEKTINEFVELSVSLKDAKKINIKKETDIENEIKAKNNLKYKNESAIAVIDTQIENASQQLTRLAKQQKQGLVEINVVEKTLLELNSSIKNYQQLLGASKFDSEKMAIIYKKIQSYKSEDISQQYRDITTAEQLIEKTKEQEQNAIKTVDIMTVDLKELKVKIAEKTERIDKAEPELKILQKKLSDVDIEFDVIQNEYKTLTQDIARFELFLKQCGETKSQLAKYELTYNTYSNLAKAYQMTKAFIVENSVPRYQESCNQMLDYLGLNIRIRIETLEEVFVKKTKETKLNKVFKIIVISGKGKERSYHTWSGGEKHRVNLALRHAMSMMLLNRNGAKLGLVVIDEGDSKLDKEGKEALLKVIDSTNSGVFGYPAKVLFMTHSEDLKDRLPTKITLEKKNYKTKVTIT